MSEEEIFQLAADLIAQGQRLEEQQDDPFAWKLDRSDSFTEEFTNPDLTLYFVRVGALADKAQLDQLLHGTFTRAYTDEILQALFRADSLYKLCEKDGKLYATADRFNRGTSTYTYGDDFVLMGRTDDVISLQAELYHEINGSQTHEAYPVTLRREDGRWLLDGWKFQMHTDNSFVQLPGELAQIAQNTSELATSLRYAWTLGDSLQRGRQDWVNWCFSGLFVPPASYQELGNPLVDIAGLVVSDFTVEVGRQNTVYLMLDVDDPAATPLRPGKNWYRLTFGRDIDRVDGVIQRMYPDSEQSAFGLGKDATDEEVAQGEELVTIANLFHAWATADPAEADWWQSESSDSTLEISYVAMRMAHDKRTDAEGRFTLEQFEQAAREYLDAPDYTITPERLRLRCSEQDGQFSLMPMGSLTDLDCVLRYLGGGLAGGNATVVCRYYKDELGLVPDYDLVYTLQRSLGGIGAWSVYSCTRQPFGPTSIQ